MEVGFTQRKRPLARALGTLRASSNPSLSPSPSPNPNPSPNPSPTPKPKPKPAPDPALPLTQAHEKPAHHVVFDPADHAHQELRKGNHGEKPVCRRSCLHVSLLHPVPYHPPLTLTLTLTLT